MFEMILVSALLYACKFGPLHQEGGGEVDVIDKKFIS